MIIVVVRVKKNRKYFGSRSWGAGNIKNARGAGDRGGVGRGGRKHKMSYYWVYDRESTHSEVGTCHQSTICAQSRAERPRLVRMRCN